MKHCNPHLTAKSYDNAVFIARMTSGDSAVSVFRAKSSDIAISIRRAKSKDSEMSIFTHKSGDTNHLQGQVLEHCGVQVPRAFQSPATGLDITLKMGGYSISITPAHHFATTLSSPERQTYDFKTNAPERQTNTTPSSPAA